VLVQLLDDESELVRGFLLFEQFVQQSFFKFGNVLLEPNDPIIPFDGLVVLELLQEDEFLVLFFLFLPLLVLPLGLQYLLLGTQSTLLGR